MSQRDHDKLQVTNNLGPISGARRVVVLRLQWLIWLLSKQWLVAVNLLSGFILFLGFLAPVLQAEGLTAESQRVYRFLAPHNHQLPQRSYFLFGQNSGIHTYSVPQLVAAGADPQRLESFVGNAEIGFKTALNQRMIAIFVAIFLGGVWWGLAGRRPQLDLVLLLLMALPLLIDGFSHMASERSGSGFRDPNGWAVILTAGAFSPDFYGGSTLGSLNWWLRTLTGLLFGFGLIWYLNTYLSVRFAAVQVKLEPKLRRAGLLKPLPNRE